MIKFFLSLFKKKIDNPVRVTVLSGDIFRINLKQYPKHIEWISLCPSTILFDQDSFEYKAEKIGNQYFITSDYNAGCVCVKYGTDFYSWLETKNE